MLRRSYILLIQDEMLYMCVYTHTHTHIHISISFTVSLFCLCFPDLSIEDSDVLKSPAVIV